MAGVMTARGGDLEAGIEQMGIADERGKRA